MSGGASGGSPAPASPAARSGLGRSDSGSRMSFQCGRATAAAIGAVVRAWRSRRWCPWRRLGRCSGPAASERGRCAVQRHVCRGRQARVPGRRRPRAARPPRATHRRGKVTKVGGIATRRHPRHTPAAATTRPVYLWCSWQKCISDQPQDQDHTAAVNQLCSRGKSTHRNMRRSANGKWLW